MNDEVGPGLLLVGAARSGTTSLAAEIGRHPSIVTPSIKEPNFFSTRFDRGWGWYNSLFPSRDGVWLDSSTQYTYPRYLKGLERAYQASPGAKAVYVVREPIERAFSHYCQEVLYMDMYDFPTFGDALRGCDDFVGASNYELILAKLHSLANHENVLVLPFEMVTRDLSESAKLVWRFAGLDAESELAEDADLRLYTNEKSIIKYPVLRRGFKALRGTRLYPRIRAAVGAERMRFLRSRLTSSADVPTLGEALSTCSPGQLDRLHSIRSAAQVTVRDALTQQDARIGTDLLHRCEWL